VGTIVSKAQVLGVVADAWMRKVFGDLLQKWLKSELNNHQPVV
jgi:hypothetical protein